MFDSVWPHGLQYARLPSSSLFPGALSNSCPLSKRCHHTISASVVPFSSCLLSFPEPGSFPMSRVFCSDSVLWIRWTTHCSFKISISPNNIQDWFPWGLTGLISLQSKGLSKDFSSTTVWRYQIFGTQPFILASSHIRTWLLEKPIWTSIGSDVSAFQCRDCLGLS